MPKTKYIFVSGGVMSGLGKGLVAASLGLLLKQAGYKVAPLKCENYLNFDSGLINPIEHGDPFLCEDGAETDMDIGTYERFLNTDLSLKNFLTMGQIYQAVLSRERQFGYGGEDVEAIPHVTDEIIHRFKSLAQSTKADIVLIELGGTTGEYQNALYFEASRIMKLKHQDTVLHIHATYVPVPPHLGEPKTKPAQLSVKALNAMGIQPDFIVVRSAKEIDQRRRQRFSLFCNVLPKDIIAAPDLQNIYQLPLVFNRQNFSKRVLEKIHLPVKKPQLKSWKNLVSLIDQPKSKKINLAIVGKYFSTGDYHLTDSYAALINALHHASWPNQVELNIKEVNSQKLTSAKLKSALADVDGIIVPIGWGARGTDGMLKAIQFARENKLPYLGLCFGMQLAVVEFARHVAGFKQAHSTEANPKSPHPVIHIIPKQKRNVKLRRYGGTMRLGAWDCRVAKNTLAYKIYQKTRISERHRHRYEFNDRYANRLKKAGLIISGRSVKENLVEIIELPQDIHPFFIGVQGHPEYKSRPLNPHPIFLAFVKAAAEFQSEKTRLSREK